MSFAGDVAFGGAAALLVEIGGAAPGAEYDQIHVADALNLDGMLSITLINGFAPQPGQSFDILDWTVLNGTFAAIVLPALDGLAWDTSQLYTTGVLSIAAAALQGDYNNDGTVDAADYVVWRKNPSAFGDDPAGYNLWRTNFGRTVSGGSNVLSADVTVPEPATRLVLILGLSLIVALRRFAVC
jgi:hypothetical protein